MSPTTTNQDRLSPPLTTPSDHLHGVAMLDMLKSDPRPTFLLDAKNTGKPIFWNHALAGLDSRRLLNALLAKTDEDDDDFHKFQAWAAKAHKSVGSTSTYCGCIWNVVLVKDRWTVISGTPAHASTEEVQNNLSPGNSHNLYRVSSNRQSSTFDWTCDPPPVRISAHIAWARSIDWASTPLGPMNTWSSQLRSIANLIMQDPRPAVIYWGPDLILLYNEPYIELLGGFHPCMGVSARIALVEVWEPIFEPFITQNIAGETVERTNTPVHMVRNEFMEETYFSFRFIPIFDSDGITIGHYQTLAETTREVVAQRRAQTLLQLSEQVPRARNSDAYWTLATDVLSRNDKDVPFALLYSVEAGFESDTNSNTTRYSDNHQECTLRGHFGLPKDCLAAPVQLEINQERGFAPYFRQAMLARNPIMIPFSEGSPAADLVRGIEWKGYGNPCRGAVICPINPTSSKDNILGYLVIGLNPRRPYDDDYRQFIMVASRLLSTSLTSILLHEEDIHRRERAIANAESMKIELRQQLLDTQKEVERSAYKFQRFAERADIGIFIVGVDGAYSYRNDAWYHILDPDFITRDIVLGEAWGALIEDEYAALGQSKFETLIETKQHQSFELRLKRTWSVPGQGSDELVYDQQPMWVLLSVFPELSDSGEVLEILGCFLDISRQKWGEQLQATQAEYARESKRQLENFIDTTSHEMRNPLSAIVQCADSIIYSQSAFDRTKEHQLVHRSVLETTIDAADTIVQCSKHMKTIVDDVLTMSKLESGLFVMTPVDVQLQSIARDAVKMFEGEARAAGVDLQFQVEDTCNQANVDNISLDPTRVLQILINLITNAIKFTQLEPIRRISVSLGVSLKEPVQNADGRVQFVRTPEAEEARTLQADWEKGEIMYIIFSVEDTGRGLSSSEHELLFARFSQTSPRTHIDYGGSGLGLFISRRLTEMHGGAIGFASKAKVGSTFSFYVKCRKSKVSPQVISTATEAANLSIRTTASALSNRPHEGKDDSPSLARMPSEDTAKAASELYILVVEDNLVNQRVLAKQLRNLGMKVAVANHGGEALEYLSTTTCCLNDSTAKPLSLILMDWEMPVMDGLTCVREIRKLQVQGVVTRHVPVIAVTANVRAEQVSKALDAGMDDVISKPFRIPELSACIHKTMASTANVQ